MSMSLARLFGYVVEYDLLDEDTTAPLTSHKYNGVVVAETFAQATQRVFDYYDDPMDGIRVTSVEVYEQDNAFQYIEEKGAC